MFSLGETFEILLEAHNKKGEIVGEAKRGGPVDVATGTIAVKPGGKVQVTVKMTVEFRRQVHAQLAAEPGDHGGLRFA